MMYITHAQAYISRARLDSFSLTADMLYISSNAPRIARALFEIVLRKGWAGMTDTMITICKVGHAAFLCGFPLVYVDSYLDALCCTWSGHVLCMAVRLSYHFVHYADHHRHRHGSVLSCDCGRTNTRCTSLRAQRG